MGNHYFFKLIYPSHFRTPPSIVMETRIEHPCVTSNHIKLDILNLLDIKKKHFVPPSTTASKYEYWYPGYTAVSILMCLEGTLATLHVCAFIVFY